MLIEEIKTNLEEEIKLLNKELINLKLNLEQIILDNGEINSKINEKSINISNIKNSLKQMKRI